jgi:8-oxo-dGTP diphosphatase
MPRDSGPEKVDWAVWLPTVRANLLFVIEDGKVLLIRKKTGLGQGKINGPGGKLEPGETALQSAVREIREELDLTVDPADCEEMGTLRFQFLDGLALHVVVFRAFAYQGTPTETREAAPLWFPLEDLPFDEMWADDRHWLRELLGGQRVEAAFVFDGEAMIWRDVRFRPGPGNGLRGDAPGAASGRG